VRSPVAHGILRGIDATAAVELDGVEAVLGADELPHQPLVDAVDVAGLLRTPQPALAGSRVRFVGEPVAIVVARTQALAEDGVDRVFCDIEPLVPLVDVNDPLRVDDELLFPDLGTNVIFDGNRRHGRTKEVFETATHVFTTEFRSRRSAAVPLETRGCIANFDDARDHLDFVASTQSPHLLRRKLATCLEIGEHQIRVHAPDVGGAFGQKIPAAPEEVAVALASRYLRRPIRWVEDRFENLMAAPHAKEQSIRLSLAVSEQGEFLALDADIVGDAGAYSYNSASALIEPYVGAGLLPGPYRIRHVDARIRSVLSNKSPVAPYRGVGWTATHSARELLIDEAARALELDPVDLRRRNLVRPEDFPYDSATGMHYDSGSYQECLDTAMDLIGYHEFRERQRGMRGSGHLVGLGVSPYVEPTGWGSDGARQSEWSFASHDVVRVSVEPSGQVYAACGTPSQGQGHATTLAQVVADAVGVGMDDVVVISQDTDVAPISTAGTRASRVAVISGGALHLAGLEINKRLRRIAGVLLEADPADIQIVDGHAQVRGDPESAIGIRAIAEAAYYNPAVREQVDDPSLVATQFHDPKATYSNGVIAAVVAVDIETGALHVERLVAVEDCGTMINPDVVDGQIRGAVAQGVGAAILEHMTYSSDGQPQSVSFVDYLLPSTTEVPDITIAHHSSPSPYTVNGVKGLGESGLISTPAAVANAVADALSEFGMRIQELPISPESIIDAVGEQAVDRRGWGTA
jgi:carbon-monoxide dehydrogenase large subunit